MQLPGRRVVLTLPDKKGRLICSCWAVNMQWPALTMKEVNGQLTGCRFSRVLTLSNKKGVNIHLHGHRVGLTLSDKKVGEFIDVGMLSCPCRTDPFPNKRKINFHPEDYLVVYCHFPKKDHRSVPF